MTAQILSSELSNLIQESKRKNSELRSAAEKSLEELKGIRSTSEAQVAADLTHRTNFVTPFIIACGTKNAKFTGIAIVCLQRVVVSRALPRSRLKDVLDAFRDASSAGLDVQLKILQALPSLLQNYGEDLKGDLLAGALNICVILLASKNGIVNNTAAATLQQLVVAVFDKLVAEDKVSLEVPTIAEAPIQDGMVQLRAAAFDAYRVFNDLCLLTESQKPRFLKASNLSQTFGLELIESVLTNHADIFLSHPEQANILRVRLMPFAINFLSGKLSFPTTVRIIRILYTLVRRHLSILVAECEMALGLLTHMLDQDTAMWKRALCMEVFRGVFAEAALVRQVFSLYDAQSARKKVLGELVAAFVRLSTEKPGVIGLGPQSTVPSFNPYTSNNSSVDHVMLDGSGVTGIITSPGGSSEVNTGISTQWSSMRVPCIDQLDKSEAPSIPETYIYSLALTCINSFSEGLAKFILPLTVPVDIRSRKKGTRLSDKEKEVTDSETLDKPPATGDMVVDPQKPLERGVQFKRNPVPLNPLLLDGYPMYDDIKICAAIVESCWPAILATCSTFLYASLDVDYYHGLVRSFQKFTHVAGLLRLSTPRDAFLTTLGKAAVPPNVLTAANVPPQTPATPTQPEHHGIFSNARGLLSVDSLTINPAAAAERTRQASMDATPPSLNTRNLLCLRALLNLGIALGPTLDSAWLIVLETLQQADFILFSSSRGATRSSTTATGKSESQYSNDTSALMANIGTEIKAVETAASRLFESTVDFPNESFVEAVEALCNLFGPEESFVKDVAPGLSLPGSPFSSRRPSFANRRVQSVSLVSPAQNQEDFFALAKLGDIASINIERLMAFDPDTTGWTMLTSKLIWVANNALASPPVRLRSVEILVHIVLEAATATLTSHDEIRSAIQRRLLLTLKSAVDPLLDEKRRISISTIAIDIDVHKIILEGLKNVLEHCGEKLIDGWDLAFEIIGSVFVVNIEKNGGGAITTTTFDTRSPRLIRSAFNSLQLICSDFLSALPSSCYLILVDTLYNFCTQDDDLNICLTTVTFFWVMSDFISNRTKSFSVSLDFIKSLDEHVLVERASSEDRGTSNAALWMLLLLRLTTVTTDERLELRNSAIQTLLRIFDAYGDQLSSEAWSACTQSIIFKMLSSIHSQLDTVNDSAAHTSDQGKAAWVETTIVVLNGVSSLLATYLHVLTGDASFATCWQTLLDHFKSLMKFDYLEINQAVFKALRRILSQANTTAEVEAQLDRHSIDLVWDLWSSGLPLGSDQISNGNSNNQDCLLSYVSCLQELYRLMQGHLDVGKSQRILTLLRETVQHANVANYSADVEYLTPLQSKVLELLKNFRTDIAGVPAATVSQMAEFAALPFQRKGGDSEGKQRPTYVALSKASMTLLESLVLSHASDPEIYRNGALSASLTSLSTPIVAKYAFPVTTKSAAPWKQAVTTSVAILKATLPNITKMNIPEDDLRSIWVSIIKITNGISAADCNAASDTTPIKEDQEFDIASFLTLRELIIPGLGNPPIPDNTRRTYTESLFYNSLIHTPEPRELPQPNQELLASLYQPRRGCTIDPLPSPRSKMSYVCLDELFSLVSVHDSSAPRIKLAQAAAPYLILRAGLALRAYIADQPLRGHMPQPISQRKELLHILKGLVTLRCEPEAIPDAPGVDSDGKKHLHRLYPLMAKAVRAAARDQEVLEWLGKALDEVGVDFGL